jgi:glucokinase
MTQRPISRDAIITRMDTYIAIDIGGTHIRAGLYPAEGIEPICVERIHTQGKKGSSLERLFEVITRIWPEKDTVRCVGLAAPGYIDPHHGVIILAPNIPHWDHLPLQQLVTEKFNVPALLGNDANLAAMGEWRYGAGKGFHQLLYLTISTGIGAGVIINDNLLLGAHGLASELGHITILPDGPICGCGKKGHLEALSSGTAIARYVTAQISAGRDSLLKDEKEITSYKVALAAQANDGLSKEAVSRAGFYLGIGIANFLQTFNPAVVILGGGVSRSGPLFWDSMHQSLATHILSQEYLRDLQILPADLGDDAGLVGALALAHTCAL